MGNVLYQLGAVEFEGPGDLNATKFSTTGNFDIAWKDVVNGPKPGERIGEGEVETTISAKVFPMTWSDGLTSIGLLDQMRAAGEQQILVRGDGANLGWWIITKVKTEHDKLDASGVGKDIDVEITLRQSPSGPDPISYIQTLYRLLG